MKRQAGLVPWTFGVFAGILETWHSALIHTKNIGTCREYKRYSPHGKGYLILKGLYISTMTDAKPNQRANFFPDISDRVRAFVIIDRIGLHRCVCSLNYHLVRICFRYQIELVELMYGPDV